MLLLLPLLLLVVAVAVVGCSLQMRDLKKNQEKKTCSEINFPTNT